jgi:hypothetical protein
MPITRALNEEAAEQDLIATKLERVMSQSKSELELRSETQPACLQCSLPMTRLNSIPAFDRYPQLDVYRCEVCGEARTIKRREQSA